MVNALIRDAPFGRLVRVLTKNRVFQYPEEDSSFQYPDSYDGGQPPSRRSNRASRKPTNQPAAPAHRNPDDIEKHEPRHGSTIQVSVAGIEETIEESLNDIEKISTSTSDSREGLRPVSSNITRTKSLPYTVERLHQDEQAAIERTESRPIAPTRTADGLTLVDWYSTDDPDNPQVRGKA
ncbi:hypothetical protein SLS60_007229 [Paraconiothyrium brasiliense]|uniref:Uncharacterized protein n=1 Tax=Paraconiothyrium brasiliense TaxID=300254 RepID=A0ABR3R8S5_9PLEO